MRGRMMAGSGRWLALLAVVGTLGCGGDGDAAPPAAGGQAAPAAAQLTPFQLEHGIGPVTEVVELPATIDEELAHEGQEEFEMKCAACHQMADRFVGPALGEVTSRRSPAFIMNMILNPQEMVEQHPVGKELLAQYMSFMPNQGITREDARAILEYLRTQHP